MRGVTTAAEHVITWACCQWACDGMRLPTRNIRIACINERVKYSSRTCTNMGLLSMGLWLLEVAGQEYQDGLHR